MKITKNDVGRKVVDGWGEVVTIIEFREGDEYPVLTDWGDNGDSYTEEGVYFLDRPDYTINLVRFLDEEENENN